MILSVHAAERLDITEDDLRFLSTLADLAGIAVDKGLRLSIQRAMNNRLEQILQLQRNLMIQALATPRSTSILTSSAIPENRVHYRRPHGSPHPVRRLRDLRRIERNDACRIFGKSRVRRSFNSSAIAIRVG